MLQLGLAGVEQLNGLCTFQLPGEFYLFTDMVHACSSIVGICISNARNSFRSCESIFFYIYTGDKNNEPFTTMGQWHTSKFSYYFTTATQQNSPTKLYRKLHRLYNAIRSTLLMCFFTVYRVFSLPVKTSTSMVCQLLLSYYALPRSSQP